MTVKFYNMIWLVLFGTAAIFYVTGNMTPTAGVVFGFAVFAWIFMGMMSVLPGTIAHPAPEKAVGPSFRFNLRSFFNRSRDRLREAHVPSMSSRGIEMGRPRFR